MLTPAYFLWYIQLNLQEMSYLECKLKVLTLVFKKHNSNGFCYESAFKSRAHLILITLKTDCMKCCCFSLLAKQIAGAWYSAQGQTLEECPGVRGGQDKALMFEDLCCSVKERLLEGISKGHYQAMCGKCLNVGGSLQGRLHFFGTHE